jgi:hypothetical protein
MEHVKSIGDKVKDELLPGCQRRMESNKP